MVEDFGTFFVIGGFGTSAANNGRTRRKSRTSTFFTRRSLHAKTFDRPDARQCAGAGADAPTAQSAADPRLPSRPRRPIRRDGGEAGDGATRQRAERDRARRRSAE